jgi:hypothetical protein
MTGNENNQATDESGADGKGSKTLAILKELKELNEDRLREVDEKIGADGTEVKWQISVTNKFSVKVKLCVRVRIKR